MPANINQPAPSENWRPGLYMLGEIANPPKPKNIAEKTRRIDPAALIEQIDAECFICKKQLTYSKTPNAGTNSREHVFPEWLWRRFKLAKDFIDFPHGKSINYAELVIPCCTMCNTNYMSAVEKRIGKVFDGDNEYAKFKQLSRSDVSLWAAKIIYGLIYHSVKPWDFDEKKGDAAKISGDLLENLQLAGKLLDGFRKRVIIDAPAHPFSILTFPLKAGKDIRLNFNYRDCMVWPTALAMRIGSVGLIVSLEDFGAMERWYAQTWAGALEGKILHPLQFSEIAARAFYIGGLGGADVSYWMADGPDELNISFSPVLRPGYDPDPNRLAIMLRERTGGALSQGPTYSLLIDQSGAFVDQPYEEDVFYSI